MHGENCYNSIDSALIMLQPRTVTSIKLYTRLFSDQFVIRKIDTGKALNLSIHLTELCSIAWWTTCVQEGALLLFAPSIIQHTLSYGSNVVLLSIHKKGIHALTYTRYAILDFNPSLDHLWWYRAIESTHVWTVAIRNYGLESTPDSGTIV